MKKTYYVCAGISDKGHLKFLQSEALSKIDAIFNFIEKYGFSPSETSGPYSPRRENSKRKITNVKFSPNSYKGTYDGWNVIATELASPKNYVFLMFDTPIDGIKKDKPNNEVVHFRHVLKEDNHE